jgi:benzoyl-CoA-dihydrodiol lyase
MRTNELDLGLWIVKTKGELKQVLAIDELLHKHRENWFVREVIGLLRRTFSRMDVSSRSIYAIVEPGSCFAGTLFELALAADRSFMLLPEDLDTNRVAISAMNFGSYAMANQLPRVIARFYGDESRVSELKKLVGKQLNANEALEQGLVTTAPDDIDWEDEVRLAIEGRAALSPDALTGLESNLRFGLFETLKTRVFGRLSAWQNWIFIRPNAVGESGALKVYGKGSKAKFNWERV